MNAVTLDALQSDVTLAAGGDRQAFGRIVTATSRMVTAVTLVETRDLEVARDAAQEAYLHAWRDLATLRNPGSFLPWLRELARRRAREARDQTRRLITGSMADEALAAAVDGAPDAAGRLLAAEERHALAAALDALPDEARETVVLYYREGRSAAQVARLLGLSEEAAWQRLSRARAQLRDDLLARAGDLFERTAPGAGFTAAVLAALGTSAPLAAGAATAASAGAGAKWAGGALGLGALVFGGAGAAALLAMGQETRLHLAKAESETERAAIRRYATVSRACLVLLGVLIPLLGFALHLRWLWIGSLGLYALALTVVQRAMLPAKCAARLGTQPGGRPALVVGQWLGIFGGLACLAAAWWAYASSTGKSPLGP
jgi:RNA polymerase sigma factor (sigma-70 family)